MQNYLQVFLTMYFFYSITLGAINSFKYFINNTSFKDRNLIIYFIFPISLLFECLIFSLYNATKKIIKY